MGRVAIDGSDPDCCVARRVVVWRRLEPGDVRTAGTELAPESPYLEVKTVEVGIAPDLHAELTRLSALRREVLTPPDSWRTRYEPAGVPFTVGGAAIIGVVLESLPETLLPWGIGLLVLGLVIGGWTRTNKRRQERMSRDRWQALEERGRLERREAELREGWDAFSARLREESGFRTEVRVGSGHQAAALASIDLARIGDAQTWCEDASPREVRYVWVLDSGRNVEQVAELEDALVAPSSEALRP